MDFGRLLFPCRALRFAIAVICLFVMVYRQEGCLAQLKRDQFWPIVGLGLSGVFAYNMFFFKLIGAAKAAIFINLVPVSAIALAWLILREPIDALIVIGGGLVITGVFCTNSG